MKVFGDVSEDKSFECFCFWVFDVSSVVFGILFLIRIFM